MEDDREWEKALDNVLLKFGVTKETMQGNAAEELESTLQDYQDLAKQYSDMLSRFSYEEKPVMKNGVWLCPSCHRRVQMHHTHCHWCGKKMGWNRRGSGT